jgi:anti-sigma28 factor (negative regulator of flagellin synthesis)
MVPRNIRLNETGMDDVHIQENEGNMRSCRAAHPSGDPSSPQERAIPAYEIQGRQCQRHVIQIEQLNLSPSVREIQEADQLMLHTLDVREIKIIALKQEVESGRYLVKFDQVAEKIMADSLLDLICSDTRRRSSRP